jgi:cysteine desulfurase/selenocysteine lyase
MMSTETGRAERDTTGVLATENLRSQFPLLREVDRSATAPFTYLDSAATTLLPDCVMGAWQQHYARCGGALGRGSHRLSRMAADEWDRATADLRAFFGVGPDSEIVFVKSATEGLNLLAHGLKPRVSEGDVVVASELEHHSNFLPWQRLARERGGLFETLPLLPDGTIDLSRADELPEDAVKIVALVRSSNLNGHCSDWNRVLAWARRCGAITVLDVTQVGGHAPLQFEDLGCDAAVISAHKMMAPKGVGAVIARRSLIDQLDPWLLGGGMVTLVNGDAIHLAEGRHKFYAGTTDVAGVVAWARSARWLEDIGFERIAAHEAELYHLACEGLSRIPGVRVLAPPGQISKSLVSFVSARMHCHDVADALDRKGIAIRSGNLCCQPALKALGYTGVNRVSWAVYNSTDEILRLVAAVGDVTTAA